MFKTIKIQADSTQAKAEIQAIKGWVGEASSMWHSVKATIWQGVTYTMGQVASAMGRAGMAEGQIISGLIMMITQSLAVAHATSALLAATGPAGIAQAAVIEGIAIANISIQTGLFVFQTGRKIDYEAQQARLEGWEPMVG